MNIQFARFIISDLSSPGELLFKLGGHKYFALFIALEANMEEFHFIYDLHCQAYDSKDFRKFILHHAAA